MRADDRLSLARAALQREGAAARQLRRCAREKRPRRTTPVAASAGLDRINSHLAIDPREVLPAVAARHRHSLAGLSRMIGRGEAYLGRFVREGVPVALTVRDHRLLADHFGLSERALGIRDLWGERGRG